MRFERNLLASSVLAITLSMYGCATVKVDMAGFAQPERAAELDAYNAFVGSWTWDAVMLNAVDADKSWTGTAEWHWILDGRSLEGTISAKSEHANYAAKGVWSWHPRSRKYMWWMFNNWGFPQEGRASYDDATRTWNMSYRSIGLDGTPSYGRYRMTVVDKDTLEWDLTEWADPTHFVVKMEMRGTYKRK